MNAPSRLAVYTLVAAFCAGFWYGIYELVALLT